MGITLYGLVGVTWRSKPTCVGQARLHRAGPPDEGRSGDLSVLKGELNQLG
ncbi:hypothetical protein [Algoriphagus sp. oki45]|uniref:hypothetical protein n=1 Tax=Algoriphagus sp. oki45 TaxID=3067294 RepID=UPI0030C6CA7E